MTAAERNALLLRLDESRAKLEELLSRVDPRGEIYTGWAIKEMLAHITGWDDAVIDSLRAHVAGREPAVPAQYGVNEYNARTVSSRQDLDLEHVLNEWRLTRQVLRTIIEQMPDDRFQNPMVVPWGEKGTVTELVDIFCHHEEEHAHDISEWLKNPGSPLAKQAN